MKRLAWLNVTAAVALAGLVACSKKEEAPAAAGPAQSAEARNDLLVRGRYLTAAGDCYACHTVRGGEPYAGGLEMATPFGALYTPNITPDKETGIGTWTASDFWGAMHDGKSKDGSFLYPAMPYTNYTKVTREDSDAIYAYIMSVKPVKRANQPHALNFPFNQRQLMLGWRTLYFKAGVFKESPEKSKEWNSLPAFTSASNRWSQASASKAAYHRRNAASSTGERFSICCSIDSTLLIHHLAAKYISLRIGCQPLQTKNGAQRETGGEVAPALHRRRVPA